MAESGASPAQSESMEDILQSIKRIIEDEPAAAEKSAVPVDVLDLTQMVTDDGSVAEVAPPKPAAAPVKAAEPAPVAAPPAATPVSKKPMESIPANPADDLVSDEAATAAMAALRPIVDTTQRDLSVPRIGSPALRGGNTVEDLLLEALRPMLKAWLDENLPVIVQKIVEKEVKRIVTFRQD